MPERYLIAHIDGGARGNPGPAGYGVAVADSSGKAIAELSEYLGHRTNNYAEYSGLLGALEYCIKHEERALKVISDSELMVKQLNGEYKVKSPELKLLYDRAHIMIRQLEWFRAEHVLREKNRVADRLANEAMDRGMKRGNNAETAPRASLPASGVAAGGEVREVSDREISGREISGHGSSGREFNGIVQGGKILLLSGELPEGTMVKVRVKN